MCRGGTGSRVLAVSIVGLVENFSGGGAGFWKKKWPFWDYVHINTVSFVVTNCLKNLNLIFGIRILVLWCWLVVCYHTWIFVHVCLTRLSSGELTCKGIYKINSCFKQYSTLSGFVFLAVHCNSPPYSEILYFYLSIAKTGVLMASTVFQDLGCFFPVCFIHHKSAIRISLWDLMAWCAEIVAFCLVIPCSPVSGHSGLKDQGCSG